MSRTRCGNVTELYPEYLMIQRMRPVASSTPPFGEPLLLRVSTGDLVVARISTRSPDDPAGREGTAAKAAIKGALPFRTLRFVLFPLWASPEDSLAQAVPFYSDEITHWGTLDTPTRRTLQ